MLAVKKSSGVWKVPVFFGIFLSEQGECYLLTETVKKVYDNLTTPQWDHPEMGPNQESVFLKVIARPRVLLQSRGKKLCILHHILFRTVHFSCSLFLGIKHCVFPKKPAVLWKSIQGYHGGRGSGLSGRLFKEFPGYWTDKGPYSREGVTQILTKEREVPWIRYWQVGGGKKSRMSFIYGP